MKGQILKIDQHESHIEGDFFYYVFFKCEDGKSRRSCLSPAFGNFKRWRDLLKVGIVLDGLSVRKNFVNADSFPVEIK